MARGDVMTASLDLFVEECCECGTAFAMPQRLWREAMDDHGVWFFCPRGHRQHYTGKTTEQQLADAKARETALRDQLAASVQAGEEARSQLLRDRSRFARGVCPCCNRYFDAVARHMASKHPDFDATDVARALPARGERPYACSCGDRFATYHGLRIHQGRLRRDGWAEPGTSKYLAHLSVTS